MKGTSCLKITLFFVRSHQQGRGLGLGYNLSDHTVANIIEHYVASPFHNLCRCDACGWRTADDGGLFV